MTTYIQYIRALKAGAIINTREHSPVLARLETVEHIKVYWVVFPNGALYREYRYEPPVATVNENLTVADAPPLAVVAPVYAHIRLADKVRWIDGKRAVSEQWSGKGYLVTGIRDGYVLLDTGYGVIGRKVENVKYAAYVAGVKAAA